MRHVDTILAHLRNPTLEQLLTYHSVLVLPHPLLCRNEMSQDRLN